MFGICASLVITFMADNKAFRNFAFIYAPGCPVSETILTIHCFEWKIAAVMLATFPFPASIFFNDSFFKTIPVIFFPKFNIIFEFPESIYNPISRLFITAFFATALRQFLGFSSNPLKLIATRLTF